MVVTRPGGEQGKEIIDGYGNPATFYQMQDNGKPVKGHASHMHYELAKDLVILTGNAYPNSWTAISKATRSPIW